MITVVIPTRNRAKILDRVLPTYYLQKHVKEIVIVDDASDDATRLVVEKYSKTSGDIKTIYFRNVKRLGASESRNQGVRLANFDYIMFGEDDAFLELNYTDILLSKIQSDYDQVGIVSGRLVLMRYRENPDSALLRFGDGRKNSAVFDYKKFKFNPDAYFMGDVELPLTHALILTRKDLLEKFPFDSTYDQGNGFREESDYQIRVFLGGLRILMTNDTHCMHLSPQDTRQGGQRTSFLKKYFWSIKYTKYFYDKYFNQFRDVLKIPYSRRVAILIYFLMETSELLHACLLGIRKRIAKMLLSKAKVRV